MSFYLFIFLYFYRNIVCKDIVCDVGLSHTFFDGTIHRIRLYAYCSVLNLGKGLDLRLI